ncbi:hypothetical protein BCV69DRAFT_282113 [Microstroma glucosiphilum]|uniref:WD40 repeat-like protein n=1 Tax=Pseudomicrostroma glucosiphilum TaxID=1684307 RepID=A0A316U955_9BASI|nr:hypothetical protein BCV69DRAFT_282113 [Pseudomicrostroma glucosiphilum]PWN21384.1 hypothetical protein BCV69DRAFT_282113 [Pseudomicrostroma glucosiphilum]
MDVHMSGMPASAASSSSSLPIHRLRFLPVSPSAPTALALSPEPVAATGRSLLAIGRQNGSIDLCTWVAGHHGAVAKGWLPQTTLLPSGTSPKKIESLAFAITSGEDYGPNKLRLFSVSGGSMLTEHYLPAEYGPSARFAQRSASRKSPIEIPGTARILSSQGGVIWCMSVSPLARYVALGCEDGHIRMIDIRDNRFEHLSHTNAAKAGVGECVAKTDMAKTRIVSLAWGPPNKKQKTLTPAQKARTTAAAQTTSDSDSDSDEEEDDWTESFLLAGTTSSLALIYALPTGRVSQKLLLPKARNEQTIVWSVTVLPDKTLVTGDSLGFVTLYDAKSRVPLSDGRFQVHDKGADILCLTVGSDGKTLYSGSVDQKVSEFALLGKKWVHTATRRLHAHDVKAVVVDPPLSPIRTQRSTITPILISASADFNLVLTPAAPPSEGSIIKSKGKKAGKTGEAAQSPSSNPVSSNAFVTFASTTQRRMPYVPAASAGSSLAGSGVGDVSLCSARGWAVLRTEKAIEIWEVQKEAAPVEAAMPPAQPSAPYRCLLQMELTKRRSRLVSHSVSPDGQLLAVSDLYETKLYSLKVSLGELQPRKIKSFSTIFGARQEAPASSAMTFTADGRLAFASWPTGSVYIVSVSATADCSIVKAWSASNAVQGRRAVTGRGAAKANGQVNGHSNGQSAASSGSESDSDEEDQGNKSMSRIDHLVVTPDLQFLICTAGQHIFSYNLDVLSPHPRLLPSLPCRPVGIACHPNNADVAAVALQDGSIRIVHLEEGASSEQPKWKSLAKAIANKVASVRDGPSGIKWVNSPAGAILVLHGATWLLTARENPNVPLQGDSSVAGVNGAAGTRRRTRLAVELTSSSEDDRQGRDGAEADSPWWTIRSTFRYQPLVHVGPLRPMGSETSEEGLAIIERPFFELARDLGGAWKRQRKFGQ